jgi:hypothetical protein
MLGIEFIRGDATAAPVAGNRIIVHICNDGGIWEGGALSECWPFPELCYRHYAATFTKDDLDMDMGAVQLVLVEKDLIVANLIAQSRHKNQNGVMPIQFQAIRAGLMKVAKVAEDWNASVHMTRFGSGFANGNFLDVERIITSVLSTRDIPVTVYEVDGI